MTQNSKGDLRRAAFGGAFHTDILYEIRTLERRTYLTNNDRVPSVHPRLLAHTPTIQVLTLLHVASGLETKPPVYDSLHDSKRVIELDVEVHQFSRSRCIV